MSEKLGSLYITRHGEAQQQRLDAATLRDLSHEEFRQKIRDLNMSQGLSEHGAHQTRTLGKYLRSILPDEPYVAVGPYLRHRQSAENALLHLPNAEIHPINEEGLAERSRGRVDASVMRAALMRTEMPDEYAVKTDQPANWVPGKMGYKDDPEAWGESYIDVNQRVWDAYRAIDTRRKLGQSAVIFTSGEVTLASLHESGFGNWTDAEFRDGITLPSGVHIPGATFENGGIVAYHDPDSVGQYTHAEIIQPNWKLDKPYEDTATKSGIIPIRR